MNEEFTGSSIDEAADWISRAVCSGKANEVRKKVRDRAVVILVGLALPGNAIVTIPHEGTVS